MAVSGVPERLNESSEFDPEKAYLGSLCKRGHDYRGTAQSVRLRSNKACRVCLIDLATKPRSERTPHAQDAETFFRRKVEVGAPDACWLWKGHTKDKRARGSYGGWMYQGLLHGKQPKRAHQAAYLIFKGDIPEGQVVRHTCDQPLCCNPAHLVLGTVGENNRDRDERGRWKNWFELPQYAEHPRVLGFKRNRK